MGQVGQVGLVRGLRRLGGLGQVGRVGQMGRGENSELGTSCKLAPAGDEFLMAIFKEGGTGASVIHINQSDNRSLGSAIEATLRGQESGTTVKIVIEE